jgi:aminopeptidase N
MNGNATTADFRREMEEASGLDLNDFFDQWLYKPGALQYSGTWQYNDKKKEVRITIDQVQTDGSMFKMPVQVAVQTAKGKSLIHTLQVNEMKNEFTIPLDAAPLNIVLDPDGWVLMDAKWVKK